MAELGYMATCYVQYIITDILMDRYFYQNKCKRNTLVYKIKT